MLIRTKLDYEDNVSVIPNSWLRDQRLSLKAKGLLAQILTHEPGWRMTIKHLAEVNGCGRDAIRSAIQELLGAGYLERSEERERDSQGRLGDYTYTTTSPNPQDLRHVAYVGKPYVGKPYVGKPDTKNISIYRDIDTKDINTYIDTKNTSKKGTRISEDWRPSELNLNWAKRERPELDHERVIEEFRDYWIAIPGQKGVKLNWDSTYRNWVRRTRSTQDTPKKSNTQRNLELHARLFAKDTTQKAPPHEPRTNIPTIDLRELDR